MNCKVFYIFEVTFPCLNFFECCGKKLRGILYRMNHFCVLIYCCDIRPQPSFYVFIFTMVENKPFWKCLPLTRNRYVYFILWFLLLENLLSFEISKLLGQEVVSTIDSLCLERHAGRLPREKYRMTSFTSD